MHVVYTLFTHQCVVTQLTNITLIHPTGQHKSKISKDSNFLNNIYPNEEAELETMYDVIDGGGGEGISQIGGPESYSTPSSVDLVLRKEVKAIVPVHVHNTVNNVCMAGMYCPKISIAA